jgi:hypothetical protein
MGAQNAHPCFGGSGLLARRPAGNRSLEGLLVAAPPSPIAELPEDFGRAIAGMHDAVVRSEVTISEAPAPQRLAPYAVAVRGEVVVADEELATGRLVVLHDPEPPDAWQGMTRCVAYARSPLDHDIATDPMLPAVGWSWLVDALETAGALHAAAGGTVTRVASERFGALAEHPELCELELRASWTPVEEDLGPHLVAFAELLCSAAGLPPAPAGVVAMPTGKRPRRAGRTGARRR